MTAFKIFVLLATMLSIVHAVPGHYGKYEHHTIHVPYKVHTIHHHHIKKVPVYKEIIKEVPKEIIKEVIKEVPVVKEVHVPVIKEVQVPVYKEVHVPVHVHHEEHHEIHDLPKGWESSGGW